jgi:hypothetical protein
MFLDFRKSKFINLNIYTFIEYTPIRCTLIKRCAFIRWCTLMGYTLMR